LRERGGPVPPGGPVPSGAPAPPEVLMLKRPGTMRFAAGAYVFPGGRVDEADADSGIGWHGPPPEEFGEKLGAPPELARALVVAAVRETCEESGVLLAGTPDGTVAEPSGPSWDADRAALNAGELAFPDLLAKRGLVVLADRLTAWGRWITPEAEPRRFDARFFAAVLPAGQLVDGNLAEADQIAWVDPADALAAAKAGEITLLPPTAAILGEFAGLTGSLSEALARPRTIKPVQPRIVVDDGHAWLEVPEGVPYPL
ncbi:MAG: NUDIX hydrolase, partial [Nocardiopsaceae bacterium]|nr:NUDIX hydrolase [Nocardiopsaceae bacterium]